MQHLTGCVQRMQLQLPVSGQFPVNSPVSFSHPGQFTLQQQQQQQQHQMPHPLLPGATPFATLPGNNTTTSSNTSPDLQQQLFEHLQQQQQQLHSQQQLEFISAQLHSLQAAAPQVPVTYTANVQMIPVKEEQSPHQVSPLSASEAPTVMTPEVDTLRAQQSPSRERQSHGSIAQAQLKIEIPTPSPRSRELQSTTPILRCASPYPATPSHPRHRPHPDSRSHPRQLPPSPSNRGPVIQHTDSQVWRPW